MKKLLIIFLLLITIFSKGQMSGNAGLQKIQFHEIFKPTPGTLIITDTQTVNNWIRGWSAESTIFYDSAANNIKIYFTGGSDSLGTTAYNNRIGLTTTTDFITYTSPVKVIGMGMGGAASDRRATSSWVGKIGNRYFALALNGFVTLFRPGQDSNIWGYTSDDGISWQSQGIKVNKATAWSGGALQGFGNTGICVTPNNTPVVIGGKYVALIEVYNGTTWVMYRGEADSLMGNWTLTHALPTLLVGQIPAAASAQLIYYHGVYHCFYIATISNVSKLFYAYSFDCITWHPNTTPFLGIEATPYGAQTDQIADPHVTEINGHLYLCAGYVRNTSPFAAQVRIWSYPLTFKQFLDQLNW